MISFNLSLCEQTEILLCLHKRIKKLDKEIISYRSLGFSSEHLDNVRSICVSAFDKISNLKCYE